MTTPPPMTADAPGRGAADGLSQPPFPETLVTGPPMQMLIVAYGRRTRGRPSKAGQRHAINAVWPRLRRPDRRIAPETSEGVGLPAPRAGQTSSLTVRIKSPTPSRFLLTIRAVVPPAMGGRCSSWFCAMGTVMASEVQVATRDSEKQIFRR